MLNVRFNTTYPFSHSTVAIHRWSMMAMQVPSVYPHGLGMCIHHFPVCQSLVLVASNENGWTELCYNPVKLVVESTYSPEIKCCKNIPCHILWYTWGSRPCHDLESIMLCSDAIQKPMRCLSHGLQKVILFSWEVWIHNVYLLETSFTCKSWLKRVRVKLRLRKSTLLHISRSGAGKRVSIDHFHVILCRARKSFNHLSEWYIHFRAFKNSLN